MKLYSKGGKYAADPKSVEKRKKIAADIPESDAAQAVRSASEAHPVRQKQAVSPDKSAVRAKMSHEERSAARKAESKARNNRNIWITAILIFCSIMIATLLYLLFRGISVANYYRNLAEQVQQVEETLAATTPRIDIVDIVEPTEPLESSSDSTEPQVTEPVPETILPKYMGLYEKNPELFGWLRIEDTVMDYPVMRSFEDNDEYLHSNFDGDYSYAGVPFADYKCSRDSDNILIFGHNMRDGSMFHSLIEYEDQSYWEEHPTIMFSDLYGDYEYEILAAFRDRVYYKSETCFKFYQFIDAENESDFDYAISQFKEKALYDTGVDAEYGDKLITLVTCAYHVDNGRFVVVARRK